MFLVSLLHFRSQLIGPPTADQLLFPNFSVKKDLKFSRRTLLAPLSLHCKHPQHCVDPVQRKFPQVGQHPHNVGPKDLLERISYPSWNTFILVYSGTLLNEHPSIVDTHDVTDNSESPDCPSIHFNIQATPEQQTPHYSV